MARPRLLDLFCGAGGAGMGYHRAGFDVVGVDVARQPRYPFDFVQADALDYLATHGRDFDAIHASPPCQAYSSGAHMERRISGVDRGHPTLLEPTRAALLAAGRPYVIENVVGAPLLDPVQLCGSSFGRPLRRHRLFESSIGLLVGPCAHAQLAKDKLSGLGLNRTAADRRAGVLRTTRFVGVYGSTHMKGEIAAWREAMGIDWMTRRELTQAIPPDYTELIGRQLIRSLS